MAPPLFVQILIPLLLFALAAGAAFVLIGLFERHRDPRLPTFAPVVLVAASTLAVFVLSRVLHSPDDPPGSHDNVIILHFLLPFLLLKFYYHQTWYRSALYGALILALVPTIGLFFSLFLSGLN